VSSDKVGQVFICQIYLEHVSQKELRVGKFLCQNVQISEVE